jgi:hypothetical protein
VIGASAFGGVHDFFHSSTWYVMRNLAIFFVLVFWVATVYWVNKDAKRRIEDPLIVWVVTAIGVVPFIGPLIYMLFRPPEYLDDIRERELEIKAMEKRLGGRDLHCPVCRADVEEEFLICPVCTTKLRDLQQAARGAVAGVPVLRDADRARRVGGACRSEASAAPPPISLVCAAAWPSNAHSSSPSPTPSSATSPARSSRASSAAA